jgi:hypothetical protein
MGDARFMKVDIPWNLVGLRTLCRHNGICEQRGALGAGHITKITKECTLLFGAANVDLWEYVPSANAYREHLYQLNNGVMVWPSINGPIPAAWPTLPAGKVGFYTIYPNPTQLLAGELDTQLKAFINSAPAQGGVLTAYAEADANPGSGGQFAPLGLTQDVLYKVHAHLLDLCKGTKRYQMAHPDEVLGYWSYWHGGGPLSGPWLPDDTATIAALTSIGTDAQQT